MKIDFREWPLCWICFWTGIETGVVLERRGGWGWMLETFLAYYIEWLDGFMNPPWARMHDPQEPSDDEVQAVTAAMPYTLDKFDWKQ